MSKLKLAALALAVSVGAATAAQAQGGQGGGRGMNPATVAMQGITLSAAQQAKVDSISKVYQEQGQKMRADMQAGGDRQAMMTQMRAMRAKQLDDLKAVLTSDDQKALFDKNVEAMRNRQRPPGQN